MRLAYKLTRLLILIVGGIGAVAICLIVLSPWLNSVFYYWVDRNDCYAVNSAFVIALVRNDTRVAKAFTAPELWHNIDTWMAKHKAINCPFTGDLEDEMMYSGGYDVTYVCAPKPYTLRIEGFLLQQAQNGCQVVRWGKICEGPTWEERKCD